MSYRKPQNIIAIILSGGAGRRYNNKDKGLEIYKSKTMIEWVINALSNQVETIVISANRNKSRYSEFNYPVTSDADNNLDINEENYQGPIAGILSGFTSISIEQFDCVLVNPCDTPNIKSNYVERLSAALSDDSYGVAVVNDGERNQNLHALIRKSLLPSLQIFFDEGGRAIQIWYKSQSIIEVDCSDIKQSFMNINSPLD